MMSKKMFVLTIVILCCQYLNAQVSLRPQAGITFADLTYSSVHGALKGGTGFLAGADLQIGSPFFVQPGLMLSSTNLTIDGVGDIQLTQMNVPVMVGYKLFSDRGPTKFGMRAFVGPDFVFNVNKKVDEVFLDIKKEDLKDFLVAGVAGIGVDVLFMFVDLGYTFGLSDYISSDRASAKVNYFTGTVGLRIGF